MEDTEIYLSDDDPGQTQNARGNACSPESKTNEAIIGEQCLDVKSISKLEGVPNPNLKTDAHSVLNADVAEFFPRSYLPVLPYIVDNPEEEISNSESISDKAEAGSSVTSSSDQSVSYSTKQCQTYNARKVSKVVQTKIKTENAVTQTTKPKGCCNCKQQVDANKKRLPRKGEINQFRLEMKYVEDSHRQKMQILIDCHKEEVIELEQKFLVAENEAKIASMKLETLQKKFAQLETKFKEQSCEVEYLRKNNTTMQSVITTHTMQYFNLHRRVLTDYSNKSRRMVFDVTAILPYLTAGSLPTATDAQKHLKLWQSQLMSAEFCSGFLKNSYEKIVQDIHLGNFASMQNLPELFTQLHEHNDILHDSFLPAINGLLNETAHLQRQNMEIQQQFSKWYNHYSKVQQQAIPTTAASSPSYNDAQARSYSNSPIITIPNELSTPATECFTPLNIIKVKSEPQATEHDSLVSNHSHVPINDSNNDNLEGYNMLPSNQKSLADITNTTFVNFNTNENIKSDNHTLDWRMKVNESELSTNPSSVVSKRVVVDKTDSDSTMSDWSKNTTASRFLESSSTLIRTPKTEYIKENEELYPSPLGDFINYYKENCVASTVTSSSKSDHNLAVENRKLSQGTPQTVAKNVEYSQLPEAVRKAGKSFCDLFLYAKDHLPEKTETEIFTALKRVRKKNKKLSGMTKEAIVVAAMVELKLNSNIYSCTDTASPVQTALWNKDDLPTKCTVCFEPYENSPVVELPCHHIFHKNCITQWFSYKSDCPVCWDMAD